jgi:hypothetical protein
MRLSVIFYVGCLFCFPWYLNVIVVFYPSALSAAAYLPTYLAKGLWSKFISGFFPDIKLS